MKTSQTRRERVVPTSTGATDRRAAPTDPVAGPGIAHRSTGLDWDELRHDIALIERRARAMRAEAVWSIARAVREWMVAELGRTRPETLGDAPVAKAARFHGSGQAV